MVHRMQSGVHDENSGSRRGDERHNGRPHSHRVSASTWPRKLPVSVLMALATQDQPVEMVLRINVSYACVGVSFAVNGEPIWQGHIYVSPPGKHLSVGRLGIVRRDEPSFFYTDAAIGQPTVFFPCAAVV